MTFSGRYAYGNQTIVIAVLIIVVLIALIVVAIVVIVIVHIIFAILIMSQQLHLSLGNPVGSPF